MTSDGAKSYCIVPTTCASRREGASNSGAEPRCPSRFRPPTAPALLQVRARQARRVRVGCVLRRPERVARPDLAGVVGAARGARRVARPLGRRLPQLPVVGDEPAIQPPRAEGHAVRGVPPPAGEAAAARRRRRVRDDRPNLRRRRLLRDARRRRAQPRGRRGAVGLRARAGGVGPLRPPRQPGARDAGVGPYLPIPFAPPSPVPGPTRASLPPPPRPTRSTCSSR